MKHKAACVMGPEAFSDLSVGFLQRGVSSVLVNETTLDSLLAKGEISFIFADNAKIGADSIQRIRKEYSPIPFVVFGDADDGYISAITKAGCHYLNPHLKDTADELLALAALPPLYRDE